MKFPKDFKLDEIAVSFREKYAETVFDYTTVKMLMAEGAGQGYDGVRISQDLPLSLEDTKSAMSLLAQLKKQKYKVSWVNNATGVEGYAGDINKALSYNELVIVWGSPKGGILHKVEVPKED